MDPIDRRHSARAAHSLVPKRTLATALKHDPRWREWPAALLLAALIMAASMMLLPHASPTSRPVGLGHGSLEATLPPPAVEPQRLLPIAAQDAEVLNSAKPFVPGAVVAASPFRFAGDDLSRGRAIDCLAAAAWYEGGDDKSLETSVIQVVLNRVRNPAFPGSVCGVVFQGSERRTGCQFTFSCDGAMIRTPSAAAWQRARALATAAINGSVDPRVGYATHYHTDWVYPYWSDSLDKIAQVGPHIFYRWKGFWGTPKAFRVRPFAAAEPVVALLANLSSAHHGPGEVIGPPAPLDPAAVAAPVVAAPLPAPIELSGVREKSLRGALVRGQDPDHFFIQLDPERFAGNYATAALAICKGHDKCTVLGWIDSSAMATSLPLGAKTGKALSFYYHREGSSERALWNCAQVARSNQAQCLPADPNSLTGLAG